MPRVAGLREKQHQPIWDTLIRAYGTANQTVASRTTLFGSTNVGSFEKSNLAVAGQLAADQTYVILSLRCWMYFEGTNRRIVMQNCISQLYFTLTLGEKPQFQAPAYREAALLN